jgi:hypothetical protein
VLLTVVALPGRGGRLARGTAGLLGEEVTVDPAPVRSVVYTDGYGNLKFMPEPIPPMVALRQWEKRNIDDAHLVWKVPSVTGWKVPSVTGDE